MDEISWASLPVRADVLIVTALKDELDAVLALGEGGRADWEERRDLGGFRYYERTLPTERGPTLRIAAAWIGEMGERAAAIRAVDLVHELDPGCLAMCGICAGFRGGTSLGDVIVADKLYSYDHGKLIAHEEGQEVDFLHDIETYNLDRAWKMDASFLSRELDLRALERDRPPSPEAQRWWLLETLDAYERGSGPAPMAHPERNVRCPGWTARLKALQKEGIVDVRRGELVLLERGQAEILEARVLYPDGLPKAPPLNVHVGAIATGNAVQQDPELFDRLRRVVRTTIGVDMEGAAIGDIAERFQKRAIVVKAVSDYADGDKDDSFRAFACRASAFFLLSFLQKHLDPEARDPARALSKPHDEDRERVVRGPVGDGQNHARKVFLFVGIPTAIVAFGALVGLPLFSSRKEGTASPTSVAVSSGVKRDPIDASSEAGPSSTAEAPWAGMKPDPIAASAEAGTSSTARSPAVPAGTGSSSKRGGRGTGSSHASSGSDADGCYLPGGIWNDKKEGCTTNVHP
jgi:nucleoside phosphorylase